jgi:phosphotransferase system HPr-like phosphotransfer protein
MMLAAGQGSRLKFSVKGKETAQFLEEMETLFNRKFDES